MYVVSDGKLRIDTYVVSDGRYSDIHSGAILYLPSEYIITIINY